MEKQFLLISCFLAAFSVSNTLATCWNETRNEQRDTRWYRGLDNIENNGDDLSLNVDNVILRELYYDRCSSAYGCDIVRYKIQWFSGVWSGYYYPGSQDIYQKPSENARHWWACFNDHRHSFEFCN